MKHRTLLRIAPAFFLAIALLPRPAAALTEDWYFRTGLNGYYSSGVARENFYLKPFAEAGLVFPLVELIPGIYRYQGYQLTDSMGNYRRINYNQAGIELLLTPMPWIDLSAGCRYSDGDTGYRGVEYFGDVSLYPGNAIISISGSIRKSWYDFNEAAIRTESRFLGGEINILMDGWGSLDAGVDFDSLEYSVISSAYTTVKGRVGISFFPGKGDAVMASCTYGQDSADYRIIGAEAGLKLRLGACLSLFATYQYSYFIAPVSFTAGSGTPGPGSVPPRSGTNPFLKSSMAGLDYTSQSAGMGISIKI